MNRQDAKIPKFPVNEMGRIETETENRELLERRWCRGGESGRDDGVIEVVCAVIVRDGRVLVCKRGAEMHLAGHWEFPGGKIEEGEEAREALVREIREELGCEVVPGEALEPVEHAYPDLMIRLRPFVCTVADGEPVALEHEKLGWFRKDELDGLGLAGADVEVAREWVG